MIEYKLTPLLQTAEVVCGPTALAMVLNGLGTKISPREVLQGAKGSPGVGLTNQSMATFTMKLGFEADLWSFDHQVLDQAWAGLPSAELATKLESKIDLLRAQSPADQNRIHYAESYLEFVKAGGSLHILPAPTKELIVEWLAKSPLLAGVSFTGGKGTHSIVIHGYRPEEFLITDPEMGPTTISPEKLIAAISAAQSEFDNSIFQLS